MFITNKRYLVGKRIMLLLLLFTVMLLAGCGNLNNSSNSDNTPLTLTSTAFENGGRLNIKHTNANENISIPLAWNKKPKGTQSYALIMVDLHPIANNWVHWAVVDIPATITELNEGDSKSDRMPEGSKQLNNTFGSKGYAGPQPPAGSGDHEYKTILYALNVKTLDVASNRLSYEDFQALVKDYVIESAEISGFYENK